MGCFEINRYVCFFHSAIHNFCLFLLLVLYYLLQPLVPGGATVTPKPRGPDREQQLPTGGQEAHMAIFAAVTLNFLLVPFLNRVWIVGSSSDTKDKEIINFSMPAINQRIQTTSSEVNLKKELAARRWRPFADIESGNSKHREYPKRHKPHSESSKITRELFSAPFCQINNS